MNDTFTGNTAEPEEFDEDLEVISPPFLRISASYPVGDDRFETIVLELNPPEELGELDADQDPAEMPAVKSWFTDFCTQVLRELRQPPVPGVVVLSGAIRELFAETTGSAGHDNGAGPASGGTREDVV